ncbi:MAG: hypothetical protein NDF53_01895 [archaeon GB-1867-097]|nr:hypothetical protein [Candidatus Verstraetearchaeota archaeon]MCS7373704.1 hypothetical protein [Candidatus Culexmicrobium thermophilum]MCS7384469.1 hypothetical protein [Candidatus Culexmicrobium thermophilum]RLE53648.1 MAG: hypothetical protein DRJ30_06580 [Candidatus Verstraetearchaeota archaeon]HDO20131.1 hypothetical protein [Candidatus Bathyarchaeota archaeon]
MADSKVPPPELPEPTEEELARIPLKNGIELGLTEDGVVIQINEPEATYQLPPAIYAVWSRCNGKTDVKSLTMDLSRETKIPMERMKPIIYAILVTLAENNLINWV